MKISFRQALSFVLAMSVCVCCCISAAAVSFETEPKQFVEETVICLSPTTLSQDERISTQLTSSQEIQNITATYSYTFAVQEYNVERADVAVQLTLTLGDEAIPIQASGEVWAYLISEQNYLWEGPLDGVAIYNDQEWNAIVGFAKLSNSDEIQMSVTLQDFDSNLDPMAFTFGQVITPEIMQAVHDNVNIEPEIEQYNISANNDLSITAVQESEFEHYKTAYGTFSGSPVTGTGQRARLYFNDTKDLAAVSLTTYASKLNDYYYDTYNTESCIHSFSIKLEATDGAYGPDSRYSRIGGISVEDSLSETSSNVYLTAIFEDAMSLLGVPTSVISACLSGVRGSAYKDVSLFEAYMSVTFPVTEVTNFDGTSYSGAPMIASLEIADAATYVGNSPYEFTTTVRYRTPCYVGTVNPTITYTYTDVSDAVGSDTITID